MNSAKVSISVINLVNQSQSGVVHHLLSSTHSSYASILERSAFIDLNLFITSIIGIDHSSRCGTGHLCLTPPCVWMFGACLWFFVLLVLGLHLPSVATHSHFEFVKDGRLFGAFSVNCWRKGCSFDAGGPRPGKAPANLFP